MLHTLTCQEPAARSAIRRDPTCELDVRAQLRLDDEEPLTVGLRRKVRDRAVGQRELLVPDRQARTDVGQAHVVVPMTGKQGVARSRSPAGRKTPSAQVYPPGSPRTRPGRCPPGFNNPLTSRT